MACSGVASNAKPLSALHIKARGASNEVESSPFLSTGQVLCRTRVQG